MQRNLSKIKQPETLFSTLIKGAVMFLSIYIAFKCINIIGTNYADTKAVSALSESGKVLAMEILDNTNVMTRYMVYLENNQSLTDTAKKSILKRIVSEYMENGEYTYNTKDPGYEEVINLVYENAGARTVAKVEETTKKYYKPVAKKEVNTNSKSIVPTPKIRGEKYTLNNLPGFKRLIEKYYIVTEATSLHERDLPIKKAFSTKFRIKGNNKKPQILIYHTHSQEEYINSSSNPESRIIGVGSRLENILEKQFGYNVIHDRTKYDMVNGKLDRNKAYDQAREGVKKILKKYPSISLVLDIHRDGVNDTDHLLTEINGKKTAQIMFFNGMSRFKSTGNIDYLYNPYLFENLALTLQMKLNAQMYYPGFSRHNYVNAYKYNLDLCKQCMLIEIGAQNNTIEEGKNAAEPLAMLINIVFGKK